MARPTSRRRKQATLIVPLQGQSRPRPSRCWHQSPPSAGCRATGQRSRPSRCGRSPESNKCQTTLQLRWGHHCRRGQRHQSCSRLQGRCRIHRHNPNGVASESMGGWCIFRMDALNQTIYILLLDELPAQHDTTDHESISNKQRGRWTAWVIDMDAETTLLSTGKVGDSLKSTDDMCAAT